MRGAKPKRPIAAGRPSTTSSSICRFIPAGWRRRARRRGRRPRRRDSGHRRRHRARIAFASRQRAGDRHRHQRADAARGRGASCAQKAGAGQGPLRHGRRRARFSRRVLRRGARALCDERRAGPEARARRGLAGVAARRQPHRHEPFRRLRRRAGGGRAADGAGRRLARLASQLPLFHRRRLDRLASRRAPRRTDANFRR